MAVSILPLLVAAAAQGHNQQRLRAEAAERLGILWSRLPHRPPISDRLRQRLTDPERLDAMDMDSAVSAAAQLINREQQGLWPELVMLNLAVARLGGVSCALRLGQHVVAALQAVPTWQDTGQSADR